MSDIYFSIPVRDSPFSKDAGIFFDALNSMSPENSVVCKEQSAVLPYHGTAGNTGIVFCVIKDNLTQEQRGYFNQFAFVYDDRAAFDAARSCSQQIYYDRTPSPG